MDAFNGVEPEYLGVIAGMNDNSYDGVSGAPDSDFVAYTKQVVEVGLPASCDPPGPNNPPKHLVWVVCYSVFPLS